MFVAPILKFHRRRRCEKGSRGARGARAGLQAQRYSTQAQRLRGDLATASASERLVASEAP
eukprot:5552884-Pleurochrysis_carterae.AAC.1